MTEYLVSGRSAHYKIEVSDNGYGMDEEFQNNIFDSFTRENDSRISKIQGTGLGMAITKSLVDLMGGTIIIESENVDDFENELYSILMKKFNIQNANKELKRRRKNV